MATLRTVNDRFGARGAFATIFALSISTSAWAQAPTAAPVVMPPPVPPSHIAAGDQYYEADLDGLRAYLESIAVQQPSVYAAMDPKLASLESRSTWGTISLAGGVAIGAAALVLAVATTEDCNQDVLSDEWEQCNEDNKARSTAIFGAGMLGLGAGLAAWLVLKPGRSDLLEVINEHNRLGPQQPLRLNLGWDRKRQVARAHLEWRF